MTDRIKAWNVISAGPSRRYLKKSDLIPGSPVVTINRALDVTDSGIEVDFAMFCDAPERISMAFDVGKYLKPPLQIWVPRPAVFNHNGQMILHDMASRWEKWLSASMGVRLTPFGLVDAEGVKDGGRFFFSLLAALYRICMFAPERVRILSADMVGTWAAGKTEEECEKEQQNASTVPFRRWEHERNKLKELEKEAKAKGITFEYVTPKVVMV